MAQTIGQVLYDNLLRRSDATITYDGTVQTGFDPANAYDWRDFSLFRADPLITSNLDATFSEVVSADTAAVYMKLSDDVGAEVRIQYETAASSGTFTQVAAFTVPAGDSESLLQMAEFTEFNLAIGAKLRIQISGGPSDVEIRQVSVGTRLDFPIGQHVGIAPATLSSRVEVDNVIAVNGSVIGRNIRRVTRQNEIDLEYLTDSWVRTNWEPFAKHMERYACYYRWDPTGHPNDVAYAVATNISSPENSTPVPLLKVSMPLKVLVD